MAHGDSKLQAALGNDISLKKYLGEAGLSLAPPQRGLRHPCNSPRACTHPGFMWWGWGAPGWWGTEVEMASSNFPSG